MSKPIPISLYGINSDKPASELQEPVFTSGENIRFNDGYVEKMTGYEDAYTPSVAPLHIMNIVTTSASYWIYAGLSKIYVDDGAGPGNPWDLTTSYVVSTTIGERWNSTYFNGLPILNPKNATPVYWNLNTGTDVQAIPGWVANDTCRVIRSFKNFLIAINIENSGNRNNNLIKWSDRASAGALPGTWAPLSTNAAGDKEFSSSDDILIDGLKLGDYFIVYKQKSCYIMQEIGGQYIFDFDDLFSEFGALAQDCIVSFQKMHAVLTIDDFVIHDGVTWESKIDSRMRSFLFNSINEAYIEDCYLAHDEANNEIMICYPSGSSTIPNKAITWNYREDVWYPPRDIPESYSMAVGVYAPTVDVTWDADSQIWNDDTSLWDGAPYPLVAKSLIAAGYTDTMLYHIKNELYTNDLAAYNSYVQRDTMAIDPDERVKMVHALWPDIRAVNGTQFQISVGVQDRPQASISWTTMTFTVGTDEKIDVDEKGRFLSYKISDNGGGVQWKAGTKILLDISDAGNF